MSGGVLPAFETWMRAVGIDWASDAIELVSTAAGCSGLALGVQVGGPHAVCFCRQLGHYQAWPLWYMSGECVVHGYANLAPS